MKKYIGIILALLCSVSLFACDDGNKDAAKTSANTAVNTDVTTVETTDAITEEKTSAESTEPPVTDEVETPVDDGGPLWVAEKDGKFGFINASGEYVIPPKYSGADVFAENGLALVITDSYLFGEVDRYIDRSGNYAFSTGFLASQNEHVSSYDTLGFATLYSDGLYGYIDSKGERVIEPQFESADPFSKNGLAAVSVNGRFGYVNTKGEIVTEPQFDIATEFSDYGMAIVGVYSHDETYFEDGEEVTYPVYKYGYVDSDGEIVIEPKFYATYGFTDNGLALTLSDEGYFGYIDRTGEFVIQPEFSEAGNFDPVTGLAPVGIIYIYEDGTEQSYVYEYGFIDKTGAYVIEPVYEYTFNFSENGLAPVIKDGLFGYINTQGEMVIEPQFEEAYSFDVQGLAIVLIDGKYGYIDETGAVVIDAVYDDANYFDENGYAIVGIIEDGSESYYPDDGDGEIVFADKYGIIDISGNVVVPIEFDDIY